jgi:methylmalonyl-CoA mutase
MSRATWHALAAKELAGAGTVEALAMRTLEGLTIEPVYPDLPRACATLPARNPLIVCRVGPAEAGSAAALVREAARGGAEGVWLAAEEAGWDPVGLRAVLAATTESALAVALDPGRQPGPHIAAALAAIHASGSAGLGWLLGIEPLRVPATVCAELVRAAAERAPRARALLVDATPFHDAGAHAVTDLAVLLAGTAECLRGLERAGCSPDEVLRSFAWRLPMERDFFGGIAKVRAARLLGTRLAESCGSAAAACVHATSSARSLTAREPHNNLLRLTVQAAAAMLGGADALSLHPFDAVLGSPGALGRRMARNTQLVLRHETGIAAETDPAGGSPHLDARARALARAAWDEFRALERGGGLARALADGSLHARLATEWEARRKRLAAREEIVLGVNLHAEEAAPPAAATPASGPWNLPRHREEEAAEAAR